jgi:hypothetical protein
LAGAKVVLADANGWRRELAVAESRHASYQTGGVKSSAIGKLTHYRKKPKIHKVPFGASQAP